MKNIVVYWSGTGNTESMANRIAKDLGCKVFNVNQITPSEVAEFDQIVLGCPAMGAEELEDGEFRPFFEVLMSEANNKKFALFGSYGWGDGEWMRLWQDEVVSLGGNLLTDGLIANGDASAIDESQYEAFLNAIK